MGQLRVRTAVPFSLCDMADERTLQQEVLRYMRSAAARQALRPCICPIPATMSTMKAISTTSSMTSTRSMNKRGEIIMSKYQVTIHFPDGDEELEDLYDTEEEAREAALYAISCWDTGSETLPERRRAPSGRAPSPSSLLCSGRYGAS